MSAAGTGVILSSCSFTIVVDDPCFQGVLLDQFGVLHDGQQPYPHAIAAVRCLHATGKQVMVLSNSSRRSGGTISKLAKMGFKNEWFAGEAARLPVPGALPLPPAASGPRAMRPALQLQVPS